MTIEANKKKWAVDCETCEGAPTSYYRHPVTGHHRFKLHLGGNFTEEQAQEVAKRHEDQFPDHQLEISEYTINPLRVYQPL